MKVNNSNYRLCKLILKFLITVMLMVAGTVSAESFEDFKTSVEELVIYEISKTTNDNSEIFFVNKFIDSNSLGNKIKLIIDDDEKSNSLDSLIAICNTEACEFSDLISIFFTEYQSNPLDILVSTELISFDPGEDNSLACKACIVAKKRLFGGSEKKARDACENVGLCKKKGGKPNPTPTKTDNTPGAKPSTKPSPKPDDQSGECKAVYSHYSEHGMNKCDRSIYCYHSSTDTRCAGKKGCYREMIGRTSQLEKAISEFELIFNCVGTGCKATSVPGGTIKAECVGLEKTKKCVPPEKSDFKDDASQFISKATTRCKSGKKPWGWY